MEWSPLRQETCSIPLSSSTSNKPVFLCPCDGEPCDLDLKKGQNSSYEVSFKKKKERGHSRAGKRLHLWFLFRRHSAQN